MSETTEQKPERLNVLEAVSEAARNVNEALFLKCQIAEYDETGRSSFMYAPIESTLCARIVLRLQEEMSYAFAEGERRYAAILKACDGIEFDANGNQVKAE